MIYCNSTQILCDLNKTRKNCVQVAAMEERNDHLNIRSAPALNISPEDAEKLIALNDGDAALLYLCILRSGGGLDVARAAGELRRTEAAVRASAAVLSQAGLLSRREDRPLPPPEVLPEYDAKDILERSRSDAAFRALIAEAQRVMGHALSGADLKTLFGIYDRLGISGEAIMLMINNCAARLKRRYGEGRLPTMHALEKEAFRWARMEIFTLPQAESFIAREERREEESEKALRALQITGRAPTPTERRYLESWLDMGFGSEALAVAYDRTVVSTGQLVWAYMDKILRSWQEKGLYTPQEIEKGDARPAGRKKPADARPAGPPAGGDDADRLKRLLHIKETEE